MKKHHVRLYIIIFIVGTIILTGCNRPQKEIKDYYIENQDQQFMYCNNGTQNMAKAEEGYYFFAGEYLYYMDFESMEPIIVCNKPNCLHNEETDAEKRVDCNALFIENSFLTYHDDYLYTTVKQYKSSSQKIELVKVSLDGTSRKKIFEFDVKPTAIAIHRGKLYYSSTAFDSEGKAIYALKEVELGKWHAQSKILYEGDLAKGSIQHIICYGNHVYFTELTINDEVQIIKQMHYDIVQQKTARLFTEDDDLYPQCLSIVDGKVYYTIFTGDYADDENKIVYKADLDGNNNSPCFELPVFASINSDGNNLIVEDIVAGSSKPDDQKSISIYSSEGEILGEFLTRNLSRVHDTFPGDENYLFVNNNTEGYYEIKAINKRKLKEEQLEVKDFFRIEDDKLYPELIIHS